MKWKRKENEKIKRLGDIMRKRKLGNEMKRKWKEKEIRKGEKREREKMLYLEMNQKIEERKKMVWEKIQKGKKKKKGGRKQEKEGKLLIFLFFVLESKSCIGWDKPQAKFTIKQKQKFTMKRNKKLKA